MNTERSRIGHRKMTEGNIRTLILKFAAPTTVGMIVIALYSLADAYFVSELGTSAGAAVGVTFAIQALLQAIGYTLGMGAGSLMSRCLGERKNEDATKYAMIAFFFSVASGLLVAVIGIVFGGPIIRLLGATDSIYPYAMSYARYLFLSAPFACVTYVVSQLLRAEGKVIYSMVGLASGSVLNIILDPILIKRLGLGISGASLATLISQAVSTLILLSAYIFPKDHIELFQKIKLSDFRKISSILFVGTPSAFRQGLTAVATVMLNHAAAVWGDAAVAAISVVTRLFLLAFSLCLGVGQGMMPVVGYNFGSQRHDRVRSAYSFSVLLSSAAMLTISIPALIWSSQLIAFFRNDPAVIAIGKNALRVQAIVFVLHGAITCTIMMLQAIGRPIAAAILACARQGLFFFPLVFFLPSAFGIKAVIYVQPVADALTFLLALPFLFTLLRNLQTSKEKAAKQSALRQIFR